MFIYLLLSLILCINGQFTCDSTLGCVDLTKVNVLTFFKDQYSMNNEGFSYNQLNCISGNACSESSEVDSIQCTNMGTDDGKNINWNCKSQLPTNLKIGVSNVACQGYRFIGDPTYIRSGSCKILYSLYDNNIKSNNTNISNNESKIIIVIFIALLLTVISCSMVCCYFNKKNNTLYSQIKSNKNEYKPISSKPLYYSIPPINPSCPPPINPEYKSQINQNQVPFYPPYQTTTYQNVIYPKQHPLYHQHKNNNKPIINIIEMKPSHNHHKENHNKEKYISISNGKSDNF
jgi:hypothetical protein